MSEIKKTKIQFRDLRAQYEALKPEIDAGIKDVIKSSAFIHGEPVAELEEKLAEYVGRKHCIGVANGTDALTLSLLAMDIGAGDAIFTSDFTYFASAGSASIIKATPIFVDIDPATGNIDPDKIEAAITPQTAAIMPVHVYGTPCDTKRIQEIADKYGLKVIYDAAHAFGVEIGSESILNAGDLSTLSFHATKVFNTIEGGAMVMHDAETKKRIDYLKNFGFAGETEVVGPGINSKMDEIRSAYGLLNLRQVDAAIEARHQVAIQYREALRDVPGITFFDDMPGVRHNYSYFPVFVDAKEYGMTRDELYFKMKENGVYGRRYFYPLISSFSTYRGLPSAALENLPNAHKMADSVICLPMHHGLSEENMQRIINCIVR